MNSKTLICGPEFDIQKVTLEFPESANRIGLMLSGGMDSTLLLHLITKYFPEKKLQVYTLDKVSEPEHAARVIAALKLTGNVDHQIRPFIHTGESQANAFLVRELFKNNEVDFLFTASNRAPVEGIIKSSFNSPTRLKENVRPDIIGSPFLNVFKYHILDLYYREEVEHLLPLTHSCTEVAEGQDGVCWWCKEREWAFSVLNKKIIPGM